MVGRRHRQEPVDLLDRAPDRRDRRGPAVGDALLEGADVLLDHRREGLVAGEQLLEALRRVGRLVLRHLGRPDLRAGHVVDRQLVLLLVERGEGVLADQDDQVPRDHLLRLEPVCRDLAGLGERRTVRGLVGRASVRAEVGPAVVVPLVAEDRRPHRVAVEDALPEPVGEVVDGSVGIEGDGHRRALPISAIWAGRRPV